MTEGLINEWLGECADLSPTELRTFAVSLSQDIEVVRALYILLEERTKYNQLFDTVCNKLFEFYRSEKKELERFTLQFLPTLIYIYLNSVAHGDIKNCRAVETLLIGLYNLEVVDSNGQPKIVSFRLPSLAMLSTYHEPSSLAPASLTESAVRRFEECNSKLVTWGPLHQVETLNAQNRLKVMTALLFIYNQHIPFISKYSLEQSCKATSKLVTQGFMKPGYHQRSSYNSESSFVPRLLPRIPVSSQFLLEFLQTIYSAMYNDCWYVGNQAVEDLHNRACYETYTSVMLVTNAIRNSTSSDSSGHSVETSIGIALSSTSTGTTVSKSMITNASFRTKKLPDDIPIQVPKEETSTENKSNLKSISENQEVAPEAIRSGSVRQPKETAVPIKVGSKITNFSGLGKKPKEKEVKTLKSNNFTIGNEKKFVVQGGQKESVVIKGSRLILNSEAAEAEGTIDVNEIRKKISMDNNSGIITDGNSNSFNNERIVSSAESYTDSISLESPVNLTVKTQSDLEASASSIQISTV